MLLLLRLHKLQGRGDGEGKVSLRCFSADHKDCKFAREKKYVFCLFVLFFVFASYSKSNKLLLVARHILTTGLKDAFKVGAVNFAKSLSPPSIVKKIRTGSKSSQGT